MGTTELLLRLAGGVVLIGANAFFVAVEFALTRLRGLGLDPDELTGGLKTAWELTERLEIHLTGCQLGISSTSILLGIVAEPAVTAVIEPVVGLVGVEGAAVRGISVVVGVVFLNLVHKIWGEQAPTYLGVERPEQVARRLAPILKVWSTVMRPLIKLGDGIAKWTLGLFGVEITRSWQEAEGEAPAESEASPPSNRRELTDRIARLLASEALPQDRGEEVLQALRIDEMEARTIMVPGAEIVWLSLDQSPARWCETIGEGGHTRYPVVSGALDGGDAVPTSAIDGILYLPALFQAGGPWCGDVAGRDESRGDVAGPDRRAILVDPVYLSSAVPVSRLIDALQDAGQEVALLVDGEGGAARNDGGSPADAERVEPGTGGAVVGMVTISDAFEAIAGDVTDPLDDEVAA